MAVGQALQESLDEFQDGWERSIKAGNQSSTQLNDGNCIIESLMHQVVVDGKQSKAKDGSSKTDGESCFILLLK